MNKLIIHTDGGSRGNPGEAAVGFVLTSEMLDVKSKMYGERIGVTTNNVAEYTAIIHALKKAKQLFGKDKCEQMEIELKSDSELLVKQLNGEYKLKEEHLFPLFIEIWNLRQDFKKITFAHVPREQNKEADKLVNRALDFLI